MKSAQKLQSEIEIDEEIPSRGTLERRRNRKLKDDITNMMVSLLHVSVSLLFRYFNLAYLAHRSHQR